MSYIIGGWIGKTVVRLVTIVALVALAACGDNSSYTGYDGLISQVEGERVGRTADHWIEMQNMFGEWERTGLIFGYDDDYDECAKAIAGLQAANSKRQYRCIPAN